MPQKRNPDLFELTRARAAALEGDLAAVMQLRAKLAGGYHRDFQLLKEPTIRGLGRLDEMLAMLAVAVPRLGVDRERARRALAGDILATDEVMRRVEAGEPFRSAYRAVAAEVRTGTTLPEAIPAALLDRRRSTGAAGNLALGVLRRRLAARRAWERAQRRRFEGAVSRLGGRGEGRGKRRG